MQAAGVRARQLSLQPLRQISDLRNERGERGKRGPRRGEQRVLLALLLENPSQMFSLFMT